jgi:putative SOS response-associated peptidase YedK
MLLESLCFSCTVITTDANALIRDIHDRMPVIIGPEDWAAWLGEEPASDPEILLKSFPPERMTLWPVNKRVGNVRNDDQSLIERVGEA